MTPQTARLRLSTSPPALPSLTLPFFRALPLRVQCAVFGAADIASLSGVASVTLMVRSSQEDTTSAPLMSKTVSAADFTDCTGQQWLAGTHQQMTFEFSAAECALNLEGAARANFWLVVKALLSGGEEVILGTGFAQVAEGNATAAGEPPENPEPGVSGAQAAALIALETAAREAADEALEAALEGKASTSHTHANATTEAAGFMSPADKAKLDTLSNYTLPPAGLTTLGGIKRNAGGGGQFVTGVAADGSLTYGTPAGGVELPMPVSAGGTGATTAAAARLSLGVEEAVDAVAQVAFINFLSGNFWDYLGTFIDLSAPNDIVRFWFSSGSETPPDPPPGGRLVEVVLTGEGSAALAAEFATAVAAQSTAFTAAADMNGQVVVTNLLPGAGALFVSSYAYLGGNINTAGADAYQRLLGNGERLSNVNAALLQGHTTEGLLSMAQATAVAVVVSGRGLTLLAAATANNVAAVTWDNLLTASYDSYLLVAEGIRPATDNVALRVILRAGGADMTNTYRWGYSNQPLTAGSPTNVSNQNATTGWTPLGADLGNDTNEQSSLEMLIHPRNGIWKHMTARGVALNTATQAWIRIGGGILESTTNATGLRIAMSSGNIATGRFKLYGLKRTV